MQVTQNMTPEAYFDCNVECVVVEQFKHNNSYGMYCYPQTYFFGEKIANEMTIAIFKVRRKPITNQ